MRRLGEARGMGAMGACGSGGGGGGAGYGWARCAGARTHARPHARTHARRNAHMLNHTRARTGDGAPCGAQPSLAGRPRRAGARRGRPDGYRPRDAPRQARFSCELPRFLWVLWELRPEKRGAGPPPNRDSGLRQPPTPEIARLTDTTQPQPRPPCTSRWAAGVKEMRAVFARLEGEGYTREAQVGRRRRRIAAATTRAHLAACGSARRPRHQLCARVRTRERLTESRPVLHQNARACGPPGPPPRPCGASTGTSSLPRR